MAEIVIDCDELDPMKTKVFLDGTELEHVVRVEFKVDIDTIPTVKIEFYPDDLTIIGAVKVEKVPCG